MANLTETPVYESGVFRLETTTPVKGGAPVVSGGVPTDGFSNVQAQQLANRTAYLKEAVDDLVLEKEQVLTAGTGVTIDRTDPLNPIINASISGGGGGDVVGPASAVNNGVALFDGITGKLIKNGGVLGTASTANVTTSSIDTTTGRVLKVGDFGLGYSEDGGLIDFNTVTWTSFFSAEGTESQGAALNWPSTGLVGTTPLWFNLQTSSNEANNRISQIATECLATAPGVRQWIRTKHDANWEPWVEVWTTGNLLNIGKTPATARAALELTGDWVDLRPYLKAGYYFDSVRNGRNSYPRIRKLSCGRVELDGVVSFNETSGPTPVGVFVNVPAPFRPPLTAGGLLFADTASPLAFGVCNWIVTGEVEYSPPRVHGDVMIISLTLPATTQNGALSINGIYWYT